MTIAAKPSGEEHKNGDFIFCSDERKISYDSLRHVLHVNEKNTTGPITWLRSNWSDHVIPS